MRKIVFLIASAIIINVNVRGQNQNIPDGGFENCWIEKTTQNGKPKFWDFKDDYFFITLNADLYTLPDILGKAPLTAFRESSDAYQGNYSLKLVSDVMKSEYGDIFLPGAMGNINIDIINVNCNLGRPFTSRPSAIKGWHKYIPVNKDSAAIEIVLKKGGNRIGGGKQIIKEGVPNWATFNVPITYTSSQTPDSIIIVFSSSAAYDFKDIDALMECKGQIGSTLYLDEIALDYGDVNIKEMFDPAIKMSVYPNPSKESVSLTIAKETNGTVIIYDYLTRKIGEYSINGTQIDIDIQDYAVGSYLINVIENGKVITTNRFVKE